MANIPNKGCKQNPVVSARSLNTTQGVSVRMIQRNDLPTCLLCTNCRLSAAQKSTSHCVLYRSRPMRYALQAMVVRTEWETFSLCCVNLAVRTFACTARSTLQSGLSRAIWKTRSERYTFYFRWSRAATSSKTHIVTTIKLASTGVVRILC